MIHLVFHQVVGGEFGDVESFDCSFQVVEQSQEQSYLLFVAVTSIMIPGLQSPKGRKPNWEELRKEVGPVCSVIKICISQFSRFENSSV